MGPTTVDGIVGVVIVDDQPLVRAGFRMVLSSQPDLAVLGEAGDGREALDLIAGLRQRGERPDIVVMDIRMPVLDGIAATRELCRHSDAPRVIVLTTFDTDEEAFASLEAGASGFLLKNAPPEDLLRAIRVVAAGDAVVAPRVTRRLLDRFAPQLAARTRDRSVLTRLTDRELEVARLVAEGLSNGEIADRLTVAEATVKTHVGRILTKLGLRDRVQVVVLAYETGLVRPGT
jgi:DNA-binding NarL/FixJ family response regulator